MFYNELREYLLDLSIPKTFHYYKHGLYICLGIRSVKEIYNGEGIELDCHGAIITVWKDSKVNRCRRPANLLKECKNCFSLCNEYDEPIGYVYN
jgi:hypothetical protein